MTEEQNKLAEEMDEWLHSREHPYRTVKLMTDAIAALRREPDELREAQLGKIVWQKEVAEYETSQREPATEAVRAAAEELADLMDDIVEGNYKPDHFTTQPIRAALKGKGASQGAGVGLTVHEADIIAAAVQLAPLLEEGWDEYDAPEGQNEGARACDALVKAVNAMLQAPDEQKG